MRTFAFIVLLHLICTPALCQEKIFADYFDIPVNSGEGTEVTGRIHLERNKDVRLTPIPTGYHFELTKQPHDNPYRIETRYDLSRRIMGILIVNKGKTTDSQEAVHRLTVVLKDGHAALDTCNLTVKVVNRTLWSLFFERYAPQCLANSRLYGRKKLKDKEVAERISELESNNWRFKGYPAYETDPQTYQSIPGRKHQTIDYEWEEIACLIGGLGRAYAISPTYGPKGDPVRHAQLKEALIHALSAYMACVPTEDKDILRNKKFVSHQIATHQWTLTDPLVVPSVYLMPDIRAGISANDSTYLKLHDSLIEYFQLFTSIVKNRRVIDNPDERWGEIQDTLRSSGAWADANLGHRLRTMLALPIIWNDYNRPMTYVQYWYSDFYAGKPFKDFSLSPGWSPHGVVADVSRWLTKYNAPSHKYGQSGFHPDGTVSHHIGHGTDAAMVAYGFEWLTECNTGFDYFKDTDYRIADKHYQFEADRLLRVYPKLFYKQRMDFTVAGRSYLSNLRKFVLTNYTNAVDELLNARSKDTRFNGTEKLQDLCKQLKNNTYEYSGTDAYWVNEYLVHRRGESEPPFYASLKLKSRRTVGAEDFDKTRKSWHAGYGILTLKVKGDEYDEQVLGNMDWHALPGLTEEWRTDPLPSKGGSQASLPGLNAVAGVLSDGQCGMGIYHHQPRETYSSANALKSYYFMDNKIIAMGSHISRIRTGQQKNITTFIDQSALEDDLIGCIKRKELLIRAGETVALSEKIDRPCWLYTNGKGYIILPLKELVLQIRTGKEVNTTDSKTANGKPNYIIAIDHGKEPGSVQDDNYVYILLPNAKREDMPHLFKETMRDIRCLQSPDSIHAFHSSEASVYQYAFFKPGKIAVKGINVCSEDAAMIMLKKKTDSWTLAIGNPIPDAGKRTITFTISESLPAGTYPYTLGGIYPREGESVRITQEKEGCKVVVELPDQRDEARYQYQSELYAAAPIVIRLNSKTVQ